MEANNTPSKRSRTTLFAVLLAAAAVLLVIFGFSRRRRKAAQARQGESRPERLASRVEAHDDPALGVDSGATVVAANMAAILLLDYPRDELIGLPLRELVAADAFAATEANLALALQGHTVGFELAFQAKDGRRIEGSAKAAPIDAAEAPLGAYLTFREAAARPPELDADAVSSTPPEH
ncbi:MAG: PAS domain S-box protein [Vulcanimicrobiaceae bacterium]